jgi:hypothetical protein
VLSEGLHGRFGCVVGGIPGWVCDALFAAGYGDGAGCGLGAEERDEGVQTVDDAEEVGLEDLDILH